MSAHRLSQLRQNQLSAVIEDPDDTLTRLAYADMCEEEGDQARSEFIRLQLKRQKTQPDIARIGELLSAPSSDPDFPTNREKWLADDIGPLGARSLIDSYKEYCTHHKLYSHKAEDTVHQEIISKYKNFVDFEDGFATRLVIPTLAIDLHAPKDQQLSLKAATANGLIKSATVINNVGNMRDLGSVLDQALSGDATLRDLTIRDYLFDHRFFLAREDIATPLSKVKRLTFSNCSIDDTRNQAAASFSAFLSRIPNTRVTINRLTNSNQPILAINTAVTQHNANVRQSGIT